jgi:hypothetical protein
MSPSGRVLTVANQPKAADERRFPSLISQYRPVANRRWTPKRLKREPGGEISIPACGENWVHHDKSQHQNARGH